MFDRTQEPSPDLNKKETSRSSKAEKVCWLATGNFGKKATVSETFKAQAQSEFASSIENAKVVSSPNKKTPYHHLYQTNIRKWQIYDELLDIRPPRSNRQICIDCQNW